VRPAIEKGAVMGDDLNLKRDAADDEPPAINIPSHDPLPPPPEISFTRPTIDEGLPRRRAPDGTPLPARDDGHTAHLGMGLAATASFGGAIWAGAFLGDQIDKHWPRVAPWGTIVMGLMGVVAGFYNLYRLLIRPTTGNK
jgi:F0F1-type ATP synthase assembly protein I